MKEQGLNATYYQRMAEEQRARAEAAEGQVAALREPLNDIMYGDNGESWLDESFAPRSLADRACHVLADTALGAQQHDERIWKEAIASVECNAVPGSSQALATPPAIQTIGGVSGGDPSREHDDRIRREALEEAADAVERWTRADGYAWERDMGESLGAGIRALAADTATASQERDDRIRREALEEAAQEAEKIEPGGIHADDAPRSTSALLNAAVEMTGKLCRTGIARRIRALIPLESQGTLPAGNPNEAASDSLKREGGAPPEKPCGSAKPQTGSSVAMQEAHNLFTLILGATYDVGMGDRTKEEALSECTKLAHDGMRVTSLPSQEAPE